MIITKSKALGLIARSDIVAKIPKLHQAHEAYLVKDREYQSKKDCPKCKSIDFFSDFGKVVLAQIAQLSGKDVEALKSIMNTKEPIYVYISDESGVRMNELK